MAKRQNLIDQTFGRLTVIEKDLQASKDHGRAYWICKCDCGKIKSIAGISLKNGATQSCGCLRNEHVFHAIAKDETGNRYGKLTVLKMDDIRDNFGRLKWICQCDCGNIKSISGADLRNGNTSSCGCNAGISKGESKICEILDQNNVSYIRKYRVKELDGKRFDFAILNNNNEIQRLIEFDGQQHFEETGWKKEKLIRTKISDEIKNNYAILNNIPLVRIPYWELSNLSFEMLFSNEYLVKKE